MQQEDARQQSNQDADQSVQRRSPHRSPRCLWRARTVPSFGRIFRVEWFPDRSLVHGDQDEKLPRARDAFQLPGAEIGELQT